MSALNSMLGKKNFLRSFFVALLASAIGDWTNVQAATISYLSIPNTPPVQSSYFLPFYGNVGVSWTVTGVAPTYQSNPLLQNQSTNRPADLTCPLCVSGSDSWAADAQNFNIFNTSGNPLTYDFLFTFPTAVKSTSINLVIFGLLNGSTATITQSDGLVGDLIGERIIQNDPVIYPGGPSSTTKFVNTGLAGVFSSNGDGDSRNTGWALYEPKISAGGYTTLSLRVLQQNGDGLGFTLGNRQGVPEPGSFVLVSLSLGIAIMITWRGRKQNSALPSITRARL